MSGGGKSRKTTVGYRYHVGMHMALCHGPVDEVSEIRVGGRTAWQGLATPDDAGYSTFSATTVGVIDAPSHEQSTINDTPSDRTDRVCLDVYRFEVLWVYGIEVESGTGTPSTPATPEGTISLATVDWRWNGNSPGVWDIIYDNDARTASHFEDPDNDMQVSGPATVSVAEGAGTNFSVSSGGISNGLIGGKLFLEEPDLFGGEGREGGIVGKVDVEFGEDDQAKNDYLLGRLGDVPGFRGLLALVLRRPYLGTVPRFKPWAVTAKREPAGWTGAPSGLIGDDANPAHIVYEAITNAKWGMAYSAQRVDDATFTDAANTLAAEGFGLSFLWTKAGQDIEGFVTDVTRYIDGSLYLDPATAQWRLKLHRADYTVGALPVLDQSNVVEVRDFSRPGWGELTSDMTVIYTDGEGAAPSWKQQAISQQNQAAVRAQGGAVISQEKRYPAITKAALANRVLARDLHQASQPLARVELVLLATEGGIRPGDVRVWTDLDYGVQQLIVRVVEVDYGTLNDGRVRIKAVEDAFATQAAVFADPTPTDWVDPVSDPAPAPFRRLDEATYYHAALELNDSDTLLGEIADTDGFLTTQAVRPSGDAFGYQVQVDAGAGFARDADDGDFCPSVTLAGAIDGKQRVLPLDMATAVDLDLVEIDTWAYLVDEILAVRAIDEGAGTVTVDRGVIDTVPVAHAAGARIFFGQDFESVSRTEYTDGEQVDVKLLPATSLGRLALVDAPADSIVFDARFIRPYVAGRVRFNGLDFPAEVDGVPALAWAHRDRTQQTAGLVDQDAVDIGPEPGTTYTVRVYDDQGALVRTVTGLAVTSYTYDEATEIADGGPFVTLGWQLEAVRDGWASWQFQERTADLYGYGRRYGGHYGGIA